MVLVAFLLVGIPAGTPDGGYRGLLLDFGGVLTTSVVTSFSAGCARLGLDPDRFWELLATAPAAREAVRRLEAGECTVGEFEQDLGALLGVPTAGLVAALVAGLQPDQAMIGAARRARAAGVRVGLLSNSWGNPYPAFVYDLCHCVVISGEVGLRKPEPGIYLLALDRLGVPASACVFVDDLPHNVEAARDLGMAAIHHTDSAATIAELERLFGRSLRADPAAAP